MEIKQAGILYELEDGTWEFAPAELVPPEESRFKDRPIHFPAELIEYARRRRQKNDDP